MRILALLPLLILLGCPQQQSPPDHSANRKTSIGPSPSEQRDVLLDELAGPATELILTALEDSEGNPMLYNRALMVVAKLGYVPGARELVIPAASKAGADISPQLLGAYLSVDRREAVPVAVQLIAGGKANLLEALQYNAYGSRKILDELDDSAWTDAFASNYLNLLRTWGGATGQDIPWLEKVSDMADPGLALRASGYLVRLGAEDDEKHYQRLKEVLAAWDDGETLTAAAEGVKISQSEKTAVDLIPLVKDAVMEGEAGYNTESYEVVLGAYALAYLPGEQAQFMRQRLLDSIDPLVRWQARLGELMHGNPEPWNKALEGGIDDQELWVAVEPPEAVHEMLLGLYALAARSENTKRRQSAAIHLNRYENHTSGENVPEILGLLVQDKEAAVRESAWYAAGRLKISLLLDKAAKALGGQEENVQVRLAAAYYVLSIDQRDDWKQ